MTYATLDDISEALKEIGPVEYRLIPPFGEVAAIHTWTVADKTQPISSRKQARLALLDGAEMPVVEALDKLVLEGRDRYENSLDTLMENKGAPVMVLGS